MQVKKRLINQDLKNELVNSGVDKRLASILGARDIQSFDNINYDLKYLQSPHSLLDTDKAANFLFECIITQKKILGKSLFALVNYFLLEFLSLFLIENLYF